jgi:hypothetical protein
MVAEKNFWKLNAPHLIEHVAEGRIYSNGVEGDKRDVYYRIVHGEKEVILSRRELDDRRFDSN